MDVPAPDRVPSSAPPHAPDPDSRRRFGRYYTPAPLVGAVHRLLRESLARHGLAPAGLALVDPSCGPGRFLEVAEAGTFGSRWGLDLDADAAEAARRAAPEARILVGDAYGEGGEQLAQCLAGRGPVAVIGNPPYVANSELLRSGRYREVRDRLLPFARQVAKGTSIRDDYALFFGVADRLVEAGGAGGAIAFVTSATFVDNFLYAPMRRWLLARYRLETLVELGPNLFEGTRVATVLSVWVRTPDGHGGHAFGHLRLEGEREERLARLERPLPVVPARPHGEAVRLNAPGAGDSRALEQMRAAGAPICTLFKHSFSGLKTRFEELLVAPDRAGLERRMRAFFGAGAAEGFAREHGIPESRRAKLEAALAAREGIAFDPRCIRRFARYAGRPHRFRLPKSALASTYLEPALIPRGDHRFQWGWDPHRHGPKLVFNVRELPLAAAVVEGEVCVHDYRHARFAPLWVPEPIAREGLAAARAGRFHGPPALNLSPRWAEAARQFESPDDLLWYVCAVFNSRRIQLQFAPLAGAAEEVPIPWVDGDRVDVARALAHAARAVPPGGDLAPEAEEQVDRLYGF